METRELLEGQARAQCPSRCAYTSAPRSWVRAHLGRCRLRCNSEPLVRMQQRTARTSRVAPRLPSCSTMRCCTCSRWPAGGGAVALRATHAEPSWPPVPRLLSLSETSPRRAGGMAERAGGDKPAYTPRSPPGAAELAVAAAWRSQTGGPEPPAKDAVLDAAHVTPGGLQPHMRVFTVSKISAPALFGSRDGAPATRRPGALSTAATAATAIAATTSPLLRSRRTHPCCTLWPFAPRCGAERAVPLQFAQTAAKRVRLCAYRVQLPAEHGLPLRRALCPNLRGFEPLVHSLQIHALRGRRAAGQALGECGAQRWRAPAAEDGAQAPRSAAAGAPRRDPLALRSARVSTRPADSCAARGLSAAHRGGRAR